MAKGTPRSADLNRLIHHGATQAELADLFKLTNKAVQKRISGKVGSVGEDRGSPLFPVCEAAKFLVDPDGSKIEEALATITPAKLPPQLQDVFWKAQLARQKFLEQRGDLWSTAHVFEAITEILKELRQGILSFEDTIESETALTEDQRQIIRRMSDSLLNSLNKRLEDNFSLYAPDPDEHGPDPSISE